MVGNQKYFITFRNIFRRGPVKTKKSKPGGINNTEWCSLVDSHTTEEKRNGFTGFPHYYCTLYTVHCTLCSRCQKANWDREQTTVGRCRDRRTIYNIVLCHEVRDSKGRKEATPTSTNHAKQTTSWLGELDAKRRGNGCRHQNHA